MSGLAVGCQCGQRFLAPPHLFGQCVPCPACQRPIQIPAMAASMPLAPPLSPSPADPLGLGGLSSNYSGFSAPPSAPMSSVAPSPPPKPRPKAKPKKEKPPREDRPAMPLVERLDRIAPYVIAATFVLLLVCGGISFTELNRGKVHAIGCGLSVISLLLVEFYTRFWMAVNVTNEEGRFSGIFVFFAPNIFTLIRLWHCMSGPAFYGWFFGAGFFFSAFGPSWLQDEFGIVPPGEIAAIDPGAETPAPEAASDPTADNANTSATDAPPADASSTPPTPLPDSPAAEPPASESSTTEPAAPPPPKSLLERSQAAFARGRETDGFRLLYAHWLSASNASSGPEWHVFPGLKRPAVALRCGVGLRYLAAGNYPGPPFPIGTLQDLPNARLAAQPNVSPNPVSPAPTTPTPLDMFIGFTGELGQRLLQELGQRTEQGQFGKFWQQRRNDRGGLGGAPDLPTAQPALPAPGAPDAAPVPPAVSLAPAVLLLGAGTDAFLLERAKAEQIDVFFLFDIQVVASGRGVVNNKTWIRVLDVAQNKFLFETSKAGLHNVQVQLARMNPNAARSVDPVEAEFKLFREFLDKELQARPLPVLSPQAARARAASLVQNKPANLLLTLLEIRHYHGQKLIGDDVLTKAFDLLLGEPAGTQLATGTPEEREAALASLMPADE